MNKIKLIVATRESENNFFKKTGIGRSFIKSPYIDLKIFFNNKIGLPKIYNKVIKESYNDPAVLIFSHDDVCILDYFWCNRIFEGLDKFEIIGLAGNKKRHPKQPSWAFIDKNMTWDKPENLSGVVGHGKYFPPSNLSLYGPPRQKVKLLDGLLIAVKSKTLQKNNLLFDEIFDFHFYDLDFCRQAEEMGISCGTWDLSVIHESGGNFKSKEWKNSYQIYLNKWKE